VQAYPVSVKGVVVRDGRVLLLHNERGEWELPGGRLEIGETPEQCVVREIAEETGWAVTALVICSMASPARGSRERPGPFRRR
jgi:ADP-ribose pyrophosphatase YjhB (NUDIX family)